MNIIDIVNSLPVHATARYRKRNLSDIVGIVVHHTTGSITSAGTLPPAIARFHVSRNFPGIAYHYFIDSDGQTYLTQRLDTTSWHCGNPNPTTIGIALRGNFTTLFPPPAQQVALVNLLRHIRKMPELSINRIAGHGQYPGASATACPGATWARWLPGIINAAMGSGEFTPAVAPQPSPQPENTTPPPPATQPQPLPQPSPTTLRVVRQMNIRPEPNVSSPRLGLRNVGDVVNVLDLHVENAQQVWVRDERGWSAVVYSNVVFMQ